MEKLASRTIHPLERVCPEVIAHRLNHVGLRMMGGQPQEIIQCSREYGHGQSFFQHDTHRFLPYGKSPETQKSFAAAIENAKTILWNGPAGVFEFDNFTAGSRAIAEAIAKATKNGAFSLIGGGDSVACINKFGMADQVSYISTGGGALLEAIEGKVLPGVAAIKGE